MLRTVGIILLVSSSLTQQAWSDLIVNSPLLVDRRVTVQPIIVSNTDGTNTAEYFGNSTQNASVKTLVNQIWAQAGIDVVFLNPNTWNNTFANIGNPLLNNPRPTSDLNTIVTSGDLAGVGNSNPLILDMYFVEIAAGFSNVSENTANGLAFLGANGITQHVGDNLPGFLGGREVIASVVAHEIGHNLGLDHIVQSFNLMEAGGSPNFGQQLNAAQISTARSSVFAPIISVPEPSSIALLFAAAFLGAACFRSSRKIDYALKTA